MVDRLRHLSTAGKCLFALLATIALVGCFLGGRRMFVAQPLVAPEAERAGDSYSIEITRSDWTPPSFASSSTFTGVGRIESRHGMMFVVHGTLRITDQNGNLVRSWAAIKHVRCSRHQNDNERLTDHSATVTFEWVWNATDGRGQHVAEGPFVSVFSMKFRAKTDSATDSIRVDRTAPSLAIEEPADGSTILQSSTAVSVAWSDDGSGVDPATGSVSLDGTPVSGLTVDTTGVRGTLDGLSVGQHSLTASVRDMASNQASATSTFEVAEEQQPGVQKTSVLGTVLDSSGQSLAGVAVNSSGASRSATTAADGSFLIEMSSGGTHWLTFDLAGYIPVQRPADVPEGQHYHMGLIHMTPADPQVTTITPDGGTAVDSTGEVEVQFPAGAVATPTDFRLTIIPSSREIPGPLNSGDNIEYPIAYTNCVVFDPGDVALAQPVTLRVRNHWGFPAGYRLPTAFYDMSTNKWVPDGLFLTVSADGTMLEKQLTSLGRSANGQRSSRSARAGSRSATADEPPSRSGFHDGNISTPTTGGHPGQNPKPPCPPGTCCLRGNAGSSTIGLLDSSFHKDLSLPSVTGAPSVSFSYSSETASPSLFVDVMNSLGTDIGQMQNWLYSLQINGQRKETVFQPTSVPSRMLYFWDGRNGAGDLSPTGLYTYSSTVSARYPAYYAIQESWGGMPTGVSSVPSGELGEKRRVLEQPLPLVNRAASPFGAGWSLAGLRQLEIQPDGKILEVTGGSPGTIYYPHINYARIAEGASVLSVTPESGTEGDTRNMLGYHGASLRVYGQIADIDYQDGFGFSRLHATYDTVLIDLGQDRQIDTLGLSFILPETTQALVTQPIVQIYTSLDNSTWTLWSKAYMERVDGGKAVGLSSPYLAEHGTAETVRYVKYELLEPSVLGDTGRTIIWRLLAFGPSERYGNGPDGQDQDYPRLAKLESGEFEQSARDGTVLRYSPEGLLQSVTDIHGQATTYTWENELLTAITDPPGGVTSFAYSNGRLSQVTDAAGRTTSFTIDGSGDLTSVRMPDGSSTSFSYDSRHLLTSQTDPRGNMTNLTWDSMYPRLTKVQKPGGGERTFATGYFQHLLNGITGDDPNPAAPPSMEMTASLTDELRRVTSYDWELYDPAPPYYADYRFRTTDPLGRANQTYLHPRMENLEVLRVEPDGTRIKNTYDENEGRFVVKVEDRADTQQVLAQYTYDPTFGKIATSSDRGGHTTTYSYDEKGGLTSTTDPLGNPTAMTYDAKGELVTVTDAEGAVTRYQYDSRGNRTKTIDPLGRETAMSYDATGNMTSLTDPAGKVTRWEYDVMGRVTKVIDPAGGETRYLYEPGPCSGGCGGGSSNLLKSITDPAGHTTSFEYDTAGHMTAVVNPLGIRKEYAYDIAGRLVRFKNGRGQEITYQYDVSNNLVKKTLPDEGDVDYTYDTNNRVTQVTDADSILRYEYATSTGPGASLKGQKMKEYFGLKGDPRYDKQGSGYIKYQYWKNGSEPIEVLSQVDLVVDQPGGTIRHFWLYYNSYDAAHRILSLGAQPGGYTAGAYFRMTYDRVGRRVTGQTGIGRPEGMLFDNTTYQYDLAGQLLELKHQFSNATPVERRYQYQYDAAGNRTSMADTQGLHAYGYDDRYQLTAATHPADPAESFTYDPVGNRLASHISPTYTYNAANQLVDDAEFTYGYDADGNCTGKVSKLNGERHEYVINSENRMIGYRKYDISSNLLAAADYFYDAIGRRIAKSVDGVVTRYIYHEEDIWFELGADGSVARSYFHGPDIDEPIGLWFGADLTTKYLYGYMADALGTIRDIANPYIGSPIAASFYYDTFGQIMPSSTTGWPDPYRFTGREWSAENGLYFFRNRFYDPRAGRFTAEDRIKQGNLFPYVDNNPTLFSDPYGLIKKENIKCYQCGDHGSEANQAVRDVCKNVFKDSTCQETIRKYKSKVSGLEDCLRNHCDADGKISVICVNDCGGGRCGGPGGALYNPDSIYVCSPGAFNGFCGPSTWGHEMSHMCGVGGDIGGGSGSGAGINRRMAEEIGEACKPK